jgi:hypothetical protein
MSGAFRMSLFQNDYKRFVEKLEVTKVGAITALEIRHLTPYSQNGATTFSIKTLSMMTFSIMTFSRMTLSMMTFSIRTHSIRGLLATLSINDVHHK